MSSSESEQFESQLQSDDELNQDLDASETDSDESDNEDSLKEKTLQEKVAEQLNKKYAERQGKQLHIRFQHKLPEEDTDFQKQVKALSPLIVKARKPRQKHARFCIVDFNSREERDIALQTLKTASKSGGPNIIASIPRTESAEFINELVQRKVNTLEKKRAKARLRRASKLALKAKNFTSSIVISNLPQTASVAEVRKLFPTAVDVQMKPCKGILVATSIAVVTLPTTMEARAAVKKGFSLDGAKLVIRFDKKQQSKKNKSTKVNKQIKQKIKNKRLNKTKADKKHNVNKIKLIK